MAVEIKYAKVCFQSSSHDCCKRAWAIPDCRLLYYLITEIKTWLNISHITVHDNAYFCILKLKEQLLKIHKSYMSGAMKEVIAGLLDQRSL